VGGSTIVDDVRVRRMLVVYREVVVVAVLVLMVVDRAHSVARVTPQMNKLSSTSGHGDTTMCASASPMRESKIRRGVCKDAMDKGRLMSRLIDKEDTSPPSFSSSTIASSLIVCTWLSGSSSL